jgi:hypothetical protein
VSDDNKKVPSLIEQASNELVSRGRFIGRKAPKQIATVHRLDRIVREFSAKVDEHNAHPHLNPVGKLAAIHKDAESFIRQLGLARAAVERHQNAPAEARAALVRTAFEPWKNDNAAPEIRAVARTMSVGEIMKLAAADARVAAALINSPSILHKLPGDAVEHLTTAYLQANHAAELQKIETVREAVDVASSMLDVALSTFRSALKLPSEHAFQQTLEKFGPTPDDIAKEAAGTMPSGVRSLGMSESIAIFNSDCAQSEAA